MASACSVAPRPPIGNSPPKSATRGSRLQTRRAVTKLTAVQCRQVLGELLAFSSGEVLVTHTTSGWFSGWLEGKRGSTAPTTFMKYRQVHRGLSHLLG